MSSVITYYNMHSSILLAVLISSIILLILSLSTISIYQYPTANAFHYFQSLTLIYWIGFTLAISNVIVLSLQKNMRRNMQVLAIILFGIYIHGVPNLVYETPRYMDVYAHGSHLAFITKTGYIKDIENTGAEGEGFYAYEYPLLFVLTAMLFNLIDPLSPHRLLVYPYNFFRLFPIFSLLLIAILIYILMLRITRHYGTQYSNLALIAPFIFLSINWASLGHFAPHTLSFILYIILIIILIDKDIRHKKEGIIIGLLLIIVINMTNPTNAAMLVLTFFSIILVSSFSKSRNIYRNTIHKKLYLIIILILVVFSAWTSFSGINVGLANAKRYLDDFLERSRDLRPQLPSSPNESYYITNIIRIMNVIFVSVTSLILAFSLIKRNNKPSGDEIVISSGLVLLAVLITVTIFASSALLARMPVYITLSFAILLPSYFVINLNNTHIILNRIKLMFVIVIAIWAYLIPITFYGWDVFFYLNPSLLYTTELLNEHFAQSATVHTIKSSNSAVRYYDSFDLENNFQSGRYLKYEKYQTTGMDYISIMLSKAKIDTINFVVLSEADKNRIEMQNSDYEFYDNIKTVLMENRFNRIIDVSTTTIFGD